MSSILTNSSSMVALQTLKSVNKGLSTVQDQISTGLRVSNAKDNASSWAVSQVMRSDVSGLTKVGEGLSLGSATVGVARSAAESISDLLTKAKEAVLGAGDLSNADTRAKLVADLTALGDTITDIVETASFNGVNLIDGNIATFMADGTTAGAQVTGSLARAADGTLSTKTIDVEAQDLSAIGTDLAALADADLEDQTAIDATLATIEGLVEDANDAAAAFGSSQKQIDIQGEFVSKFVDALNTGIGALVDADMEEASAKLQALQVQQQLGIQALSIANQAPQNVLSLFR